MTKRPALSRDWLGKSLAGLVSGLLLGLAAGNWVAPRGHISQMDIQVQLAMWVVVPVWAIVQAAVFLFPSSRRAWLWLTPVTALALLPQLDAAFLHTLLFWR